MSADNEIDSHNVSRRSFLKGTGSLGFAISGAGISSELLAENYSEVSSAGPRCDFSALAPDFVYLNSGTEGSMPACVLQSLKENQAQWASQPTHSYETDKILGKHQHHNREKVANFLAVGKNNICLTDNTTMGLSMVLMGLNFRQGDRAIVTNHEHNAIASPLQVQRDRAGISIVERRFPPAHQLRDMDSAALLDYLFPDTPALRGAKALCVSHVYPSTGTQLPLDLLRKKADDLDIQYLVVDGAQAFGMLDLSPGRNAISNCDFYACPGHKWLNGPPSTGILYLKNAHIRPPELYPVLSQRMGKYQIGSDGSVPSFPMAEALQVRGACNAPGFAAMLTAIDFQQRLGGPERIQAHILAQSNQFKSFIADRSPRALVSPFKAQDLHSGLSVFFPFSWKQADKTYRDKPTADFVVDALLKKGLRIRSIGFQDSPSDTQASFALRVSTAVFNTPEHLSQLKASLQEVLSQI